ncbi:hypothetical protein RYX36_000450 [Vicia faba]
MEEYHNINTDRKLMFKKEFDASYVGFMEDGAKWLVENTDIKLNINTDRKLMFKKEFNASYVGFVEDGAKWLVENTDIKLVGVDYLSVAAFVHSIQYHLVFSGK